MTGGDKLHCFFPSLHKIKRLLLILCSWHQVLPWSNQCIFLMEMFFLSYINKTMYFLCNLPFFKMVLPKTKVSSFLKPWAGNSSTNQYTSQLFYGQGMTHLLPSKIHTVGEGPGETPSAPRCLSELINSFLTDVKCFAKNRQGGILFVPFWCLSQKLSLLC